MMKKKAGETVKKHNTSNKKWLLLPVLFFTTVFLFCVRLRIVRSNIAGFFWYAGKMRVGDLYCYFRAQALIAVTIAAVLYLLYRVLSKKDKIEKHIIYIPMAVYSLMVILSYVFCEYKKVAWMGYIFLHEGTLVLLCYMILLFYSMYAVKSEKDVSSVVKCFAAACFLLGIWGIMQLCGIRLDSVPEWLYTPTELLGNGSVEHNEKYTAIDWFFGNQNYVSFFVVFPICVFAMSCIAVEETKKKLLYAALTGLMLFSLWQAASLGGMVGFAAAAATALIVAGIKNIVKWKKSIAMLLVAGVISIGVSLPVIMRELGIDMPENPNVAAEEESVPIPVEIVKKTNDSAVKKPKAKPLRFSEIENIITDGANVTFEFKESAITISVENDEIKSITDGAGNPVLAGNELFRAYTKPDEREDYQLLVVETRNMTWPFAIVDGEVYHKVPSGRLIKLDRVERIGFEGNEDFATYRGYIWSRTLPLLKETVLLGHGADTFAIYFPQDDYAGKYNIGYINNNIDIIIDKPHNMYLGAAVNTGVVSMIALIAIYGIYLIESFKIYRKHEFVGYKEYIGMGIFIATAGFMVSALVNDSTVYIMPVVYVFMGMGLAINKMIMREKAEFT